MGFLPSIRDSSLGAFFGDQARRNLRASAQTPIWTATALLSLIVGLGASTAVFVLLDAIFLRPLPAESPQDLVALHHSVLRGEEYVGEYPTSQPNYRDLVEALHAEPSSLPSLVDAAAWFWWPMSLTGDDDARRVDGAFVSGSYFSVLGLRPALGRLLEPRDDDPDAAAVAVIGHEVWTLLYGGDPDVLGRTVRVNDAPFTVVGVAPRGFRGVDLSAAVEVWTPLRSFETLSPYGAYWEARGAGLFRVFARLAPGATLSAAAAEMHAASGRLAEQFPKDNEGLGGGALPLVDTTIRAQERAAYRGDGERLIGPSLLLALIACCNVSLLLYLRTRRRAREIAVRRALGASRIKIVEESLTETMILFGVGGLLSLVAARWMLDAAWAFRPARVAEGAVVFDFDLRIWLFAALFAFAAGSLAGLLPAWTASSTRPAQVLRGDLGGAGRRRVRPRHVLVVIQTAAAWVALLAATVFIQELRGFEAVDLGFAVDEIAVLSAAPGDQGYDEERRRQYWRRALEEARGVPGVDAAALSENRLLRGATWQRPIFLENSDRPVDGGGRLAHRTNLIGTGFFEVAGIPRLAGRDVAEDEPSGDEILVVINRFMAETLWPSTGDDPVGRRFRFDRVDGPWARVIGVVEDARYRHIDEEPQFFLYAAASQNPPASGTIHVRTSTPEEVLPELRRRLRQIDPNMPLFDAAPLRVFVDDDLRRPRGLAYVVGASGAAAWLLALIGLAGTTATSAARHRRDIAIRRALGASLLQSTRGIWIESVLCVVMGIAFGVAAARWLAARFVVGFAEIAPWNVAAAMFAGAGAVIVLIILRTVRETPAEILRREV